MTAHDLPLLLDRGSAVPLAAQLAEALRRAILDGTLRQDEPLPSSRTLAASVRVSRGTVVAAYDQLAGEGYLLTRPGAATRILVHTPAAGESRPLQPASTPPPAPAAAALIDLAPGHPSTRSLVDPAWTSAWRAAVAASGRSYSPPAAGTERLRAAIAEHVRRARGLGCSLDDVVVTAGTSDALASLGLALGGRHPATVAVEDPGYPAARRVLSRVGAQIVPVPTDAHGIDLAALAALAALTPPPDAVLVTPSHQYPLGGSLSVQNRLDLLDWAHAAGAVVIEDDYDSEFRFDSMPLPALASLDDSGRVALVGSFSKTITPWIRCGYIVTTGDLGREVRAVRHDLDPTVSGVQQDALARYLESGALARNITRMRREYSHRRSLVLDRLGALPGVRLDGLDGGLHAVVHVDPTIVATAADLVAAAAARGVRVASLADYAVVDRGRHGLVLGYGAPTDLGLGRALDVLAGLLRPGQLPPSSRRNSVT
jgi:GntR family transcriptional regulator/MocR family aminotransferase